MLCYIADVVLHCRCCATLQMLCYIADDVLHCRCSATLQMFCYIVDVVLHCRCCATLQMLCHIADGVLHCRCCATFQMLCYIPDVVLHCRWCATLQMVCYVTWPSFSFSSFSCYAFLITKFFNQGGCHYNLFYNYSQNRYNTKSVLHICSAYLILGDLDDLNVIPWRFRRNTWWLRRYT